MNASRPYRGGITMRSLQSSVNTEALRAVINSQLQLIDAKIQYANGMGLSFIEYELPSTFDVGNMEKADLQVIVYSELVEIYRKPEEDGGRGFTDTTIDLGPKSYLRVKWNGGMSPSERDRRRAILKSAQVKK